MKRKLSEEFYKHLYIHIWQNRNNIGVKPVGGMVSSKDAKISKYNYRLYYNQFRPIFLLLRLFGRLNLQVLSKGKFTSRVLSWHMFYCVITYSLQTYCAVLSSFKRINSFIAAEGNYDDLVFAIHILIYLNIHFHVPFTYWLKSLKIAEYLNHWTALQENWRNTFGKEMKLSLKNASYIFIAITMPLLALFLLFEQYAVLHDPWLYLLPYYFTLGSTMLIMGLWYCTCIELGRLSRTMITELKKNLEVRPSTEFLRHWRYLWTDLTNLTSTLGDNFSAILTSILLTFGATFLLGIYNALTKLVANDFSWITVGYLLGGFWSLSVIFTFCDAGYQATNKVKDSAMECLLKSRIHSLPAQDIAHEIELLFKAVDKNKYEISLGGFTTLNRALFMSFAANTLTYLIVLLQFRTN